MGRKKKTDVIKEAKKVVKEIKNSKPTKKPKAEKKPEPESIMVPDSPYFDVMALEDLTLYVSHIVKVKAIKGKIYRVSNTAWIRQKITEKKLKPTGE